MFIRLLVLTYIVEGILLIHDCVQENAHRPDVLLFAAISLTLQDLWCCIVYSLVSEG